MGEPAQDSGSPTVNEQMAKDRADWERSASRTMCKYIQTGYPLFCAEKLASFVKLWLPVFEDLAKLRPEYLKKLGFDMRKDFKNTPGDLLKTLPGGLRYFLTNFEQSLSEMKRKSKE